ncbi:GRAS family transcription factor [Striga asiatica]|uniref:GRAS family transcription factor n=1 Tax=Striga asiatica TaxID=4170 RepID=A0A5A7PDE2_STRAF|nr:GRAS family transcription factor [Striga asiatica]
MQIPTLIDALSTSHPPPPLLRLTAADASRFVTPTTLDLSHDELGARLVRFARSRNVPMEFTSVRTNPSDGFSSLIEHLRLRRQHSAENNNDEALVINCHMMLHYAPDETLAESGGISCRTAFLNEIRRLNPRLVVVVDEDADFTSSDLVSRLRSAYDYLWMPYDAVDTLLPEGSEQREWYEAEVCRKIEDVVAREGGRRVERVERKGRWARRMRAAGFVDVGFGEEAVAEVKGMLEEHAAGWGLKREEEGHLVLTWKGHNAVFATVWVPAYLYTDLRTNWPKVIRPGGLDLEEPTIQLISRCRARVVRGQEAISKEIREKVSKGKVIQVITEDSPERVIHSVSASHNDALVITAEIERYVQRIIVVEVKSSQLASCTVSRTRAVAFESKKIDQIPGGQASISTYCMKVKLPVGNQVSKVWQGKAMMTSINPNLFN